MPPCSDFIAIFFFQLIQKRIFMRRSILRIKRRLENTSVHSFPLSFFIVPAVTNSQSFAVKYFVIYASNWSVHMILIEKNLE